MKRPPAGRDDHVRPGATAFDAVYRIVRRIPRGRVATYGQISRLMGGRFSPRFVGWALHALGPGRDDVPWHRVVGARGRLSTAQLAGDGADEQRHLLAREGVRFGPDGRCDMDRHGWDGRPFRSGAPPIESAASSRPALLRQAKKPGGA